MLKILSANTLKALEKEAEQYVIESLGSLTISNGHYFISFLGNPKEEPKVEPKVTKEEPKTETKVTEEKPKETKTTTKKRTPRKPKKE